jgi:hypothetical protein
MGLPFGEEDVFNSNDVHAQNSHNQKASWWGAGVPWSKRMSI